MNNFKHINSPMAHGNGAYVIHRILEKHIEGYRVSEYHPNWTLFPISLRKIAPTRHSRLVHTTPDYAVFSHYKNVPLVISFQNYVLDYWMRDFSTWLQRIHYRTDLRLLTHMAIERATAITAVSKFTAELVKKDLKIKKPIHVIHNAVEESVFYPTQKSYNHSQEIRVFFSGNLTKRKGVDCLVGIAERLQPNVVIYYTQGLRTRRTLPKHNNLKSVGPVPYQKMPSRYREMDILLMPTVREGFSLSVLEAMACGLPVVASDCSSLPEQIDDGKGGYLCPISDVKKFAEKINHLADSPNKRRDMGSYNRSKVEQKFSINKMVKEYKILFANILD